MDVQAIGIFDSGVGGLTVAQELASQLPHESLLYLGDTARCPYGPRSQTEVAQFVLQICSWLEKQGVKLIVIACNTATAAGLELAQQRSKVPVLGVVHPGARAALFSSRNRQIGVIGTLGTINSGVYEKAIRSLDAGARVHSVVTQEFVDVVEKRFTGLYSLAETQQLIARKLAPLKSSGIDTLVLGCTHFPVLAEEISREMTDEVRIISSAQETALEVLEVLKRRKQLNSSEVAPSYHLYTTGTALENFKNLSEHIFSKSPCSCNYLDVDVLATTHCSA